MIEVNQLSKRFGSTTAVDRMTFTIQPGVVTGFLGPNGAGKSTTMRMILGLDRPTEGSVRVNGRSYAETAAPIHEVGALLDAKAIQGGRSAVNHLRWVAAAGRVPERRVREVLELVGLSDVAGRRTSGFSLGMSQRLGIATAMLGDPGVLLFDEPVNGLDPEGIRWIRQFLRSLAAEGRTVLVSSHLMSEMEETADQVIVVGRGRVIADMEIGEFRRQNGDDIVSIQSPRATDLVPLIEAAGGTVTPSEPSGLEVRGLNTAAIATIAARADIPLHELASRQLSLEDAYMQLTRDSVEYQSIGGNN